MVASAVPQQRVLLRRLFTTLLVLLALGGIVFAFQQGGDEEALVTVRGVESVTPSEGDFALRQDRVIADLETGQEGVLVIDGVEIPEDQLQRTPELGIVSFAPGEGREIEQFAPGRHRAVVIFWDANAGRESGQKRFAWSFNVH